MHPFPSQNGPALRCGDEEERTFALGRPFGYGVPNNDVGGVLRVARPYSRPVSRARRTNSLRSLRRWRCGWLIAVSRGYERVWNHSARIALRSRLRYRGVLSYHQRIK